MTKMQPSLLVSSTVLYQKRLKQQKKKIPQRNGLMILSVSLPLDLGPGLHQKRFEKSRRSQIKEPFVCSVASRTQLDPDLVC